MRDVARQYLGIVKKKLRGLPKAQQGFLLDLQEKIREYASENPKCDFTELCQAYGQPEELAQYFLNELDPELFLQTKKKRNRLFTMGLVLALLLIFAVVGIVYWQAQNQDTYPIRNVDYKGADSYQKTWVADAKDGNHLNVYVENASDSDTPVSVELHPPGSGNYYVAVLQPGKNQVWNLGSEEGIEGKYELIVSEDSGNRMHVHVNARQYGQDRRDVKM